MSSARGREHRAHQSWPVNFGRRRWHRPSRPWPFVTIALTGSIAMGKSTAAAMMQRFGWPLFNADNAAHGLMKTGGAAVQPIAAAFAGVLGKNGIDRQLLGQTVFGDATALSRLEGILHPMIREKRRQFLMQAALRRAPVVVLDVPLLFETGGDRTADVVVVATAPLFLQNQRAMARKGMTAERLRGILARQMADHTKRRQAYLVLPSGLGKRETLRRLWFLRHLAQTSSRPE